LGVAPTRLSNHGNKTRKGQHKIEYRYTMTTVRRVCKCSAKTGNLHINWEEAGIMIDAVYRKEVLGEETAN